jgi:hypothetical protein
VIVFQNSGEIDIRSISTFGVSVKESDNPIGFFGTGLKYAIAVLLRTGHKVTIHSGLRVVRFGVQSDAVRGKDFDFVTMTTDDGQPVPIGFTTELGKQWHLWMAYREIACNAKDEGGSGRYTKTAPLPEAGSTHLIVEGQDFEAVHADSHLFILADEPAFTVGTTEVRNHHSQCLFYRGVRVMDLPRPSVYTYNLNAKIDLTEDRTVKSQWDVMHRIVQAILQSKERRFIYDCITAADNTLEAELDFHGWSFTPSSEFVETVGTALADKMCKVNASAMRVWKDATKKEVALETIELTRVQQTSMDRALHFCDRMGYAISKYPVKVVESLGDGILGLAQDETIYVAQRVFELGGAKQLAATLIEEYLHLSAALEEQLQMEKV